MDLIEIRWSTANIDEARYVCRLLVKERLAAQAEIIPWIESIFLLDDQLNTSQQSKVCVIASFDHFDQVKTHIEKNSTYEIPEITFCKIDGITPSYLKWIQEGLGDK